MYACIDPERLIKGVVKLSKHSIFSVYENDLRTVVAWRL